MAEPQFHMRAKDNCTLPAVKQYLQECLKRGLHDQAQEVVTAVDEIQQWRDENPDKCKDPDHKHGELLHL